MVVRWTVSVGAAALFVSACGSSQKGTNTGLGSGGAESTTGGNRAEAGNTSNAAGASSAGHSGASQAGNGQGGNGQGDSELMGIGNGELDTSCLARTSVSMPGSRIVLRNAVTSEGDKVSVGLYDTLKQEECEIRQDAEGKYRCLPPASEQDLQNRFFLDDKCSDEIEYKGICALDYQAEPVSTDACDERRRIFAFGEPLADTMVYSSAGGQCKPYNVLNNLYRRGAELVATEYAEVKPAVWRGAGRIWAQGYEGDGNLHAVSSLIDSQINEPCDFQLLADGKEHCVPQLQGNVLYTDATCKQTILTSSSSCGSPLARYASGKSGDACKLGKTIVKADASYTEPLYVRSSCMSSMITSSTAFSVKQAPDSDFLSVESKALSTDSGRLKPMYRNAADGGCFFHDWWDEQLQTSCSFVTNSRGLPYYCLPAVDPTSLAVTLETFSDSECKVAAPYVQMPNCSGGPPKFAISAASTCIGNWRTIRTVASTPSTPPPLWMSNGGSCFSYTPSASATFYATSEAMPNSMFVQATVQP